MNSAEGVSQPDEGPKRKVLFLMGFATLLIVHVVANLWWLAEDRHSIQSDESLHMRAARDYYEVLVLDDSKHLGDRFLEIFQKQNSYPPLSHLFAVAVMAIRGYGPDEIALTGTILFLLLLLGVYAVARQCVPPWEALFATTVASFVPLLYGASRNFMTDYASAVFVVWAMYCLIKSNTFRNTGWVFTFALLTGIGMMTRQTTVVFYLVPCIAVVCLALIEALLSKREEKTSLRRVVLNVLITVTVSAGIIAPWHLEHVAFLREFWNTHFFGGRGIFDQAFVALGEWRILAYAGIGAVSILVLWASIASVERLRKGSPRLHFLWVIFHAMGVVGLLAFLLTNDAWSRLALLLIKNGIFLPIFLLAVVGLFRCIDARYRTQPLFLVALWLLGSYVILSFVFNSRVPRYFVPAAAPLGIFAALAISSLRNNALRWGSGLLLIGLLLFQFANLTFISRGSFRLPALASVVTHERLGKLAEAPLPIFKDKVIAGNYAFHSAQREDGFADRLLKGMAVDMESRRKIYEPIATYQRLTNQSQFEGLWFAERHYWPTPNPFALDDVEAGTKPIKAIGTRWQKQPEDLLGRLDATDFVLIKTEVSDQPDGSILEADVESGREDSERWEHFFLARDFERVDQFHERRYNNTPGGIYTLLGRKLREYTSITEWNFDTLTKKELQWHPSGTAQYSPSGAGIRLPKNGPLATLGSLGKTAEEFRAIRVELQAHRGDDPTNTIQPEKMHLYWASPEDAQPGQWPFSTDRAYAFHRAGENLWEADMARHFKWGGAIDSLMLGIDFAPPSPGTMKTHRRWDFTKLDKKNWEWTFDHGADKAEHGEGAHWMRSTSGPMLTLDKPVDPSVVGGLRLRIEPFLTTRTGRNPIALEGIHVAWGTADATAFQQAGSVPLQSRPESAAEFVANFSGQPHWQGEINRLMLSVDLPETKAGEHITFFVKEIALLKQGQQDNTVNVLLKHIALLQ